MHEAETDRRLIVEGLHLLLLKTDGRSETVPVYRALGETAALLADLSVVDLLTVDAGDPATVSATQDAAEPDHPVLRPGLTTLQASGPGH